MVGGRSRRAVTWGGALLGWVLALAIALQVGPAQADPELAAAPSPGAMTVYSVTNSNGTTLSVEHVIMDPSGFNFSFWSQIPPGATVTYHLRDIAQVPSPFQGTMTLYASQPFVAQIVGYDYPASTTSTPTSTPAPPRPNTGLQARVWIPFVVNP